MQQELIDLINKEIPQDDSTHQGEKLFLYGLCRALVPKVVVETGTHRGKTSMYLAQAIRENGVGHLWTVDPFDWGQVGNFIKIGFEKEVTFEQIRGDKLDVKDIDLLFIDGYHEKQNVIDEVNHFLPRLSEEAVVIFHDCWDPKESDPDMVNAALKSLDLSTIFIPSFNAMRMYGKHTAHKPGWFRNRDKYLDTLL